MTKFMHSGYNIRIEQDPDPHSPEDVGDDDVFLVTTSNRHFQVKREGFELERIRDGYHDAEFTAYPLYAYIHSGVALSLSRGGQFADPWDSAQIGYVLVKKNEGYDEEVAHGLVKDWNQYLSGDVWGYVMEDEGGNDIDSCWGFYGQQLCIDEAKRTAEYRRASEERTVAQIAAMMHV